MRINVVTVFPDYLKVLDFSLIRRAANRDPLDLHAHDLRDHIHSRRRTIDDTPLSDGAGTVTKPDMWSGALDEVLTMNTPGVPRQVLIVPTPTEGVLTQRTAEDLAGIGCLVFICGRYEGIDVHVPEHYASYGVKVRELSIDDYVLNGGEVATIVMIEVIARLLLGVPGNPKPLVEESHGAAGLLEYPIYTRSTRWRGLEVDPILLSGDHGRIARARWDQAFARTAERRPDVIRALDPAGLDREDRALLTRLGWAVPAGADHPIPVCLCNATTNGVHALTELTACIFPDACGNVIDPEFLERHTATNLVPELFAAWADDDRVDLILAKLLEPPSVRGGNPERRVSTGIASALIGYAAVLRKEADSDEERSHEVDPRPTCIRSAGGEVVGELSKVYVNAIMRGSGLVPTLMDAMTRQAGAHGTDLFRLGTRVTNKRAQKAYKRAGFRQVDIRTYNVGD